MTDAAVLAGAFSTAIFVGSYLPMLVKAGRTRDLDSYSRTQLVLATTGNVVNSLYVFSLPVGPIWCLHLFNLGCTLLMLAWHLRYAGRTRLANAGRPDVSTSADTTVHAGTCIVLPDGGLVELRPLERGEIEPQLTVLRRMSEASRHQRFLAPMPPRLPAAMRAALSDVDGHRHVALLASVDGQPVGVARYIRVDAEVAELAFEVVDDHQGRGIGSALLEALATAAVTQGVRRFKASVHPDNISSVRLLRRVGLQLHPVDGLLEGESPLRLAHLVA